MNLENIKSYIERTPEVESMNGFKYKQTIAELVKALKEAKAMAEFYADQEVRFCQQGGLLTNIEFDKGKKAKEFLERFKDETR